VPVAATSIVLNERARLFAGPFLRLEHDEFRSGRSEMNMSLLRSENV
jgi:hypothetical protein